MTGDREQQLLQATDLILDARRNGALLNDLPAELQPVDIGEIYFIQDNIAVAFGEIGGWKIGAPNPETTPTYAPMPKSWISADGSLLHGERFRFRGLEAEIAFLVGKDLPLRAIPYTREDVLDAMASCHPAIEELETAFTDPGKAARNATLADLQMHGAFIYGAPIDDWRSIDWNTETVSVTVDGIVRVERTGSNTSGDLLKLLPYLANEAAWRTGGLKAGQWITTGSWTGNTRASVGSAVVAKFSTAGSVVLRFA